MNIGVQTQTLSAGNRTLTAALSPLYRQALVVYIVQCGPFIYHTGALILCVFDRNSSIEVRYGEQVSPRKAWLREGAA